jgi:hypothetical protein
LFFGAPASQHKSKKRRFWLFSTGILLLFLLLCLSPEHFSRCRGAFGIENAKKRVASAIALRRQPLAHVKNSYDAAMSSPSGLPVVFHQETGISGIPGLWAFYRREPFAMGPAWVGGGGGGIHISTSEFPRCVEHSPTPGKLR